jgi:hypothetical protein
MEIRNMDLYFVSKHSPGWLNRRRHSDKILWPAREREWRDAGEFREPTGDGGEYIGRVFTRATAYERERDEVFALADKINREGREYRAQAYADELNAQRQPDGLRDVVFEGKLPPRRNRGEADRYEQWQKIARRQNDMRHVGNKLTWKTAFSRWKDCEDNQCQNWIDCKGCLDRQRAKLCVAL